MAWAHAGSLPFAPGPTWPAYGGRAWSGRPERSTRPERPTGPSADHRARPELAVAFSRRCLPGLPIADLGCGPGSYFADLRRPLIGLDGAAAMLDLARRAAPDALLVQADLAALPFRRGRLGGAWARASFLHVGPQHPAHRPRPAARRPGAGRSPGDEPAPGSGRGTPPRRRLSRPALRPLGARRAGSGDDGRRLRHRHDRAGRVGDRAGAAGPHPSRLRRDRGCESSSAV